MAFKPAIDDLHRHHLFSGMTDAQLDRLIRTAHLVRLDDGEQLFGCGEPAERFFLVQKGQLKLYRTTTDGTEKVMDIVGPGESFAEAIMFMKHKTYPVNAEALMDSEVISVENRSFMKILNESVDTCFQVMADMSMRLRRRLNDIESLSTQNATLRFVSYLLKNLPESSDNSVDVELAVPKQVVASRLSIQPESLSRILKTLSKSGLIEVRGSIIHIKDLKGLEEIVN